MNYKKIHDEIVVRARASNRSKKTGVYESHHILMRAMGGDDSADNLVLLTPREHFIIHYLLWKINPGVKSFRDPIFMFKHKGAKNSRLYEAARLSHIQEMKCNNPSLSLSDEAKASKSSKLKAHVKTPEHCANISKAAKGKQRRLNAVLTDESKNKISDSLKYYFENNVISDETREKLRLAHLGKKHSPESLEKQKNSARNRKKYKCPHCEKSFDGGNLKNHMKANNFTEEEIQNARK